MEKKLLFITFFMTLVLQAQTNTFIGAFDNNWNNNANWSLNLIPTLTNDVVIPTGKTILLNSDGDAKSIQLEGTATLNLSGNLSIAQLSLASAQSTINWTSGNISGGGTLNNLGKMNILPAGSKQLKGGTTINNSGTITQTTDWSIDIIDGTINNLVSGVIDLQTVGAHINASGTGSHLLTNSGIIKKTGVGNSVIFAELHNTGTISVALGILELKNNQNILTGGIYNISSEASLIWSQTQTVSGTLNGDIEGYLHWAGTVNVPVTANFNFSGNGTFNWGNGHLTGGGILTNSGLIWMTGDFYGTKLIENNTTFNNAGTIKITNDWSLDITDGTLNNLSSGVIDIQTSLQILASGSGNHILNNAGLIKKTGGTGFASILAQLNNTGTISVESGFIEFKNPLTTLTGGIYNTSSGCYLFNYAPVTCSGILTGLVEGGINWVSDVNVPIAATFNFTGNGSINWGAGTIKGGGTLTNSGILDISPAWVGNKFLSESTTLINTNSIRINTDTSITMNGCTITNLATGTIDIQSGGNIVAASGINVLNNNGLLKKSGSTGTYTIGGTTNNNGTIDANSGLLNFSSLNNALTGSVMGNSMLQVPTAGNFTNNGVFAPGGEPGVLSFVGDYKSTSNTRLQVQLYGLTSNSQYDSLSIQGNAVMAGTVVPELYFDPEIGNTFIVATTSGVISSCDLANTAYAIYNGQQYAFSVSCQNDNKVVLTLTQKNTLSNESFASLEKQIVLSPNPAQNLIFIKNNGAVKVNQAVISDASGRIIQTIKLTDDKINLYGYATGLYFMKLNSDEGKSIVKRFIVE